MISPQIDRTPREPTEPPPLAYTVLRDRGNHVATRYGLTFTLGPELRQLYTTFGIDLEKANGDASWTLPIPARFVIDRHGVVRAAEADPDYTHRPEPADTVAVLREVTRLTA